MPRLLRACTWAPCSISNSTASALVSYQLAFMSGVLPYTSRALTSAPFFSIFSTSFNLAVCQNSLDKKVLSAESLLQETSVTNSTNTSIIRIFSSMIFSYIILSSQLESYSCIKSDIFQYTSVS